MAARRNNNSSLKSKVLITLISVLIIGFFFRASIKPIIGSIQSHASEYFHDYEDHNYTFGIDISHYQGKINWDNVIICKHPIKFVFIRATMGSNRKDNAFQKNWSEAKKAGLLTGAYHYYDPNQNSTQQAENFINSVKLKSGDFPPVLDIEELSKFGNSNLHKGLQNYLQIIENHYGVKPIIYTGFKYFRDNLKENFLDYPLWVAAYSRSKKSISSVNWKFHQFTDKVSVYGINDYTDGNDFNGSYEELKKLLIK